MWFPDPWGMSEENHREEGPVAVAGLLLFVQGAVAVALAVEAVGAALIFGGVPGFGAILSVAGATVTLVLVARLPKRRRSTRRWIMGFQVGWLTLALVDLLLAVTLASRGLTPTGFLVRMVLPALIFWLLHRPAARVEFRDNASGPEVDERFELEEMSA